MPAAHMMDYTWQNLSPSDRAEFWASLAIKYSQGIGPRLALRLMRHFGSAYAAIQNLAAWDDVGIGVEKSKPVSLGAWRDDALVEWRAAQSLNAHIIMWHHEQYPKLLRNIIDAPLMFYALGDIMLLNGPCLAIVGSRKCTAEGVQVAGQITRDLANAGITIVSGMAQGIDRVAHMAALHNVGKSIAVLGTGINVAYPRSNADIYYDLAEHGLVISEFAPNTAPTSTNFPIRNRIISGISLGVLVVEGSLRSGTLITARQALEQNRDVFAIPGATTSITSQGCQELIRQGAKVVFKAEDILYDMSLQLQDYATVNLSKTKECLSEISSDLAGNASNNLSLSTTEQIDAECILKFLHSNGESHVDNLCVAVNKPVHELNTLLMSMELMRLVKRMPGARYVAQSAHTEIKTI